MSACQIALALTCFAVLLHWRSLAVSVQSRDTDGVRSVWDQIVQEGIVDAPGNQGLLGEGRGQTSSNCPGGEAYLFRSASSCITYRSGTDNVHNDLTVKS